MTLIGYTMMCEQVGPKQLTQKAATMQLFPMAGSPSAWARGRISTNTSPTGNGRT